MQEHIRNLRGIITALITPFKNGQIDEESFKNLIEFQIKAGVSALVPCGTTGESPTLSHQEHNDLMELCVKTVAKRLPVIAGTGSNSTSEAIMMAKTAQKIGADAIMVVAPYYNKPTQEGLFQHFKAICNSVNLPIIIYNNPGRACVDISDQTIARIAEFDNIVGIKDASGNLERPVKLRSLIKKPFLQFSGDDGNALAFNAVGGHGCISVASNIIPTLCGELQNLWFNGKCNEAIDLNQRLMPIFNVLFCETNPIPVKYAAKLLGLCHDELRLPLVEPSEQNKQLIYQVLTNCGILSSNNKIA